MPDPLYFKSHPLRVARSMRHMTIGDMLDAEKATLPTKAMELHPSRGAFIHYGGVELADKLSMPGVTASPEEWAALAHTWNASCGHVCRALLFYVWRICAKEQRHGSIAMAEKAFGPAYDQLAGPHVVAELNRKHDWEDVLNECRNVNVGPYLDAVSKHYHNGGWKGAYGGKKWGDITDTLRLFIDGKASAMLAADRCWTLVHNTGPIFNKGFYFVNANPIAVLNKQAHGSVFELGLDYLSKDMTAPAEHFRTFAQMAIQIIKRTDPGYLSPDAPSAPAVSKPVVQGGRKVQLAMFAYTMKDRHHG